jgi:dephospho-CoA kinase
MYLIGLTGGIASGKSLVSRRLAEHGAVVVDADVLAREVVEPGSEVIEEIARQFGHGVIAPDGSLDRAALGAIIFPDPAERQKLNAITHPAVWARAREAFAKATAENPDVIVVYDVPLLVEAAAGRNHAFDLVVVVNASIETRSRRLVEDRGMTREEAAHRLNSQASNAERLAIADVVIENEGTLEQLHRRVDALWEKVASAAVPVSEPVPKLD